MSSYELFAVLDKLLDNRHGCTESGMQLSRSDGMLFYKLHRTLMMFVNEQLKVIPGEFATPEEFGAESPEARVKVRDAFLENRAQLLDAFVEQNPAKLMEDELDIVGSWRHLVSGKFYAFRYLKKYTVFLSSEDPPIAYGVLALAQPFEELIGPYLPILTQAVLLPFKGAIIYDGLMTSYRVSFGSGIRRMLGESFKKAKESLGIVTSLPHLTPERANSRRVAQTKPRVSRRKSKLHNPFLGRWRITQMEQWEQDFVDAEVEGYFEFKSKEHGDFQFGYVSGNMHCRLGTRDGSECVEWTWEGNDEMDPAHGRGWAIIENDELHGLIVFHNGDESTFVARRQK